MVHGLKRRSSSLNTERIDHLYQDPHEKHISFKLHYGDLTDATNLIRVIQEVQPDEIYNLGAMSHVKVSFDIPEYSANADGLGTLRILEAVRAKLSGQRGKKYWRSLDELDNTPAFHEMLQREFPQQASEWIDPVSRRGFMKLMGASLAMAGLAGCTKQPDEPIFPYIKQPEDLILGKPVFDASAPWERVMGRRLCNWWVDFETLHAGIGDSLFGMRVYPARELLEVMESHRSMRRFDFDAES